MSKQDIFPPARMPNHLCDLYGQYIGFGSAGGTAGGAGVSLTSVGKSALFQMRQALIKKHLHYQLGFILAKKLDQSVVLGGLCFLPIMVVRIVRLLGGK